MKKKKTFNIGMHLEVCETISVKLGMIETTELYVHSMPQEHKKVEINLMTFSQHVHVSGF